MKHCRNISNHPQKSKDLILALEDPSNYEVANKNSYIEANIEFKL